MEQLLETEAAALSHYLVGDKPTKAIKILYREAVAARHDTRREKAFDVAVRHPTLLPYLDAYDAWFRPSSQLRQRLHLMFSILEATPEFAADFLPSKRSAWYMLILGLLGIRGILRLAVGGLIVKVWGL